tara:strand:- start:4427 stop:5113 length:687 start_codon:yes stop_codon:yes gene_type:complete
MPTKSKANDPYRITFGNLVKIWRDSLGLSQQDLADICKDYGIKLHNSQFSHIEQFVLDPKADFFINLAKLMKIFEEGKFKKVSLERVKRKLEIAEIELVRHEDGKAWTTACDWFGCFVGEIPAPKGYTLMTGEKAKEISDLCRNEFEKKWKSEKDKRTAKRNTWDNIFKALETNDWAKKLKGKIGDVLNDLDDFNAEDARAMQDKKGKNILLAIIEKVPVTELPENHK